MTQDEFETDYALKEQEFEVKRALFELAPDDYFADWLQTMGVPAGCLQDVLSFVLTAWEMVSETYIAPSSCYTDVRRVSDEIIWEVGE